MKPSATLGVFAAGLALTFGVAAAVGEAVGPLDVDGAEDGDPHGGHEAPSPTDPVTAPPAVSGPGLTGLAVAADGYRLVAGTSSVAEDAPTAYTFSIEGPDGAAVTEFDEIHERLLHFIVVSRNLVDFLHLHAKLGEAGEWSVELPALAAGSYRVYADFKPTGAEQLTLATDLEVPGDVAAVEVPAVAIDDEVDGYRVERSGGDARVGEVTVTFDVSRNGEAVATEPYLGAAGHLVVIRAGDLGYLHVHPLEQEEGSTSIRFVAEFPSAGTYRLFLDFAHEGEVRTASFTVDVGAGDVGAGTAPTGTATTGTEAAHGGHG